MAASVVLLAGCQPPLSVPTWSPGPNGGLPGALLQGTLLFDDGCFWMSKSGESQDRVSLLWPPGFTGALEPARVIDGQGTVVARAGDELTMGGGFVEMDASPCGSSADGVWLIGEVELASETAP